MKKEIVLLLVISSVSVAMEESFLQKKRNNTIPYDSPYSIHHKNNGARQTKGFTKEKEEVPFPLSSSREMERSTPKK